MKASRFTHEVCPNEPSGTHKGQQSAVYHTESEFDFSHKLG